MLHSVVRHRVVNVLPILLLLGLAPRPLQAGKYNPVLKIGDQAPAWSDLPGVDGKKHGLEDLKDKQVVVVVFTCNTCPYAVAYEDRILEFVKTRCGKKDSKVALVAINVNKAEKDRLPAMKQRAETKKFNFPYLWDETQQIAQDYGATYTPEFFVLNKDRKIVYMGAMDDSDDPKKVQQQLLEQAVEAALTGEQPEVSETVAVGCTIRYDRSRRRKK